MWERVAFQERAVARLKEAAARPVHSYLLSGPRGAGTEDAARGFGAALIASADDERTWDLALRGRHPDIVEIDPPEAILRVEHAATVVEEAHRSPVEGGRKAILLLGAERLNEAAANKLLKTLEEPPATAHLVLVSSNTDQLIPTIRSRCQEIRFAPLAEADVRGVLEAGGVASEQAAIAARLAGGDLGRARRLAGRLAAVRAAFVDAAAGLDGTGGAVALQVGRLNEALGDTVAQLETAQAAESDELAVDLAEAGYADRVAATLSRRLAERHRREHRRARSEALLEGITAFESVYRDSLAGPGAPALNADRPAVVFDPLACTRALRACRAARDALAEFNPRETLLLERLLLHLPAPRSGSAGRLTRS